MGGGDVDMKKKTLMGYTGVVKYLAQQGISKKARQNGHLTRFSVSTVKAILDNPVYCGKIAYVRRKTEKIEGTRKDWGIHPVLQSFLCLRQNVLEARVSPPSASPADGSL